jgi:CRP/FNR family transcriptional regulator, anaerobic regulatory protein
MTRSKFTGVPIVLDVDLHNGEEFLGRFKTSAISFNEIKLAAREKVIGNHHSVDITFTIDYGINKFFKLTGIVSHQSENVLKLSFSRAYLKYFEAVNQLLLMSLDEPETKTVNELLSKNPDVCKDCTTYASCLMSTLQTDDRQHLQSIISQQYYLDSGQHIFHAEQPFRYLYLVRSGTVKSWCVFGDGHEHIIQFHYPGDIIGLSAISSGVYDCNATTLNTCSLCKIPFDQYQKLADSIPTLSHQFIKLMSHEIVQNKHLMELRGNRSAPARLAIFLNDLSRNLSERGFSANAFNLPMSRRDIADYLGLAEETVSRAFSQLQDEGLLDVQRKYIRILDNANNMKSFNIQ